MLPPDKTNDCVVTSWLPCAKGAGCAKRRLRDCRFSSSDTSKLLCPGLPLPFLRQRLWARRPGAGWKTGISLCWTYLVPPFVSGHAGIGCCRPYIGMTIQKSPSEKSAGEKKCMEIPTGAGGQNRSGDDPTEYRCYIKEVFHQYATAGAEPSSQAWSLRPRHNSPLQRHFTRRNLLCCVYLTTSCRKSKYVSIKYFLESSENSIHLQFVPSLLHVSGTHGVRTNSVR